MSRAFQRLAAAGALAVGLTLAVSPLASADSARIAQPPVPSSTGLEDLGALAALPLQNFDDATEGLPLLGDLLSGIRG